MISPDGSRYVYGAVEGGSVQLWLLDLATSQVRVLTPDRAPRYDPVWSPDGERIAYWVSEPNEIRIFDLAESRERTVYSGSDEFLLHSVHWGPGDTIIFVRSQLAIPRSIDLLWWSLSNGGASGRWSPTAAEAGQPAIRYGCCGGARMAVWAPAGNGAARCIAGPMVPVRTTWWGPGGTAVLIEGTAAGDSLTRLYRADAVRGGAHPVDLPPFPVSDLSASAAGRAAFLLYRDSAGPSELWLMNPPSPVDTARATVPACPLPPDAIARFVRDAHLPGLRSTDVSIDDPALGLRVFSVEYGDEMDWGLYESRVGISVGERIGWLEVHESGPVDGPVVFRYQPDPGDPRTYDLALLRRLGPELGRTWLAILLRDPNTPRSFFAALVDSAEAGRDGYLARTLADVPQVNQELGWLIRLHRVAGASGDERIAAHLLPHAVQLAADPRTDEDILVWLARHVQQSGATSADALPARISTALEGNPSARQSAAVRDILIAAGSSDLGTGARGALMRLLNDDSAPDSMVRVAVQRFRTQEDVQTMVRNPRVYNAPNLLALLLPTALLPWPTERAAALRILMDRSAPEPAVYIATWATAGADTVLFSAALRHRVTRRSPRILARLLMAMEGRGAVRPLSVGEQSIREDLYQRLLRSLQAQRYPPAMLADLVEVLQQDGDLAIFEAIARHPGLRGCPQLGWRYTARRATVGTGLNTRPNPTLAPARRLHADLPDHAGPAQFAECRRLGLDQ